MDYFDNASQTLLVGPEYGRMMLIRFTNIDKTILDNERYWTWLTIRVKNS